MGQLNSIVTSKIQFVKSNKDILIIGARLKYALLLFFALFTKMKKMSIMHTNTYLIQRLLLSFLQSFHILPTVF